MLKLYHAKDVVFFRLNVVVMMICFIALVITTIHIQCTEQQAAMWMNSLPDCLHHGLPSHTIAQIVFLSYSVFVFSFSLFFVSVLCTKLR